MNTKLIKLTDAAVPTLVLYDTDKEKPLATICSDGEISFLTTGIYADHINRVLSISYNFKTIYNSL